MNKLYPNFRLWIYARERKGVFGDGKARLLEKIHQKGSLQEAAKSMRISYRKAWGDLKKAEICLQKKLVQKERGGKGGGRTALTDYGLKILKAFYTFRKNVEKCVNKEFARMKEML